MSKMEQTTQLDPLVSVLLRLIACQEMLEKVVREKLDAMRRCDSEGMMSAAGREGELTLKIMKLDDERREVAGALAHAINIPIPANIANLTLRVLASHLAQEDASRLMELGRSLRAKMLKVAEANRVVEIVCREMMAHFRIIFTAFTQDEDAPRTYSRGGEVEAGAAMRVLDAVG